MGAADGHGRTKRCVHDWTQGKWLGAVAAYRGEDTAGAAEPSTECWHSHAQTQGR
jgi:hypothetical protein